MGVAHVDHTHFFSQNYNMHLVYSHFLEFQMCLISVYYKTIDWLHQLSILNITLLTINELSCAHALVKFCCSTARMISLVIKTYYN